MTWILRLNDSARWLARWRLQLFKFDIDVAYRAGVKHKAADALFRLQTTGEGDATFEDDLRLLAIDMEWDHIGTLDINANSDNTIPLDVQEKAPVDSPPISEKPINKQALEEYCNAAFSPSTTADRSSTSTSVDALAKSP